MFDYQILKWFGLCLILAALVGCEKEVTLPIPEDKMVLVLQDIHIVESAVLQLSGSQKDSVLNVYYDQICAIHQIGRADLDTSIVMLKRNPDIAARYYDKVYEGLEKQKLKKE